MNSASIIMKGWYCAARADPRASPGDRSAARTASQQEYWRGSQEEIETGQERRDIHWQNDDFYANKMMTLYQQNDDLYQSNDVFVIKGDNHVS